MACLASHVLVRARCRCLLDLEVAILTRCISLEVPHASGPGLMALGTLDLFGDMHILRQTCRLGEFLAKVAVASSSLNRTSVANERAPAAAAAV